MEVLLLHISACEKVCCRLYKSVNGEELTPISYCLSMPTMIIKYIILNKLILKDSYQLRQPTPLISSIITSELSSIVWLWAFGSISRGGNIYSQLVPGLLALKGIFESYVSLKRILAITNINYRILSTLLG